MDASGNAEADLAAVRKTTTELVAAVNASDVDGVMAVWDDDGVLMPPNHPLVKGRTAIREYFRGLFRTRRFAFQFTSSEIEVVGDLASEQVTYTVTIRPASGEGVVEDIGKGLHVYSRQADGSWKLRSDIWNTDRSAPQR